MVTLWATGDVITAARLNDYNCQSISIKPSTIGASAITIRDTGDTADKIILREDGSVTLADRLYLGATDTYFYRFAAGIIKTDGWLEFTGFYGLRLYDGKWELRGVGTQDFLIKDLVNNVDKIYIIAGGDVQVRNSNLDILNGGLEIGGTEVITSGRVLQNIASLAQSLSPDTDDTKTLGTWPTPRWSSVNTMRVKTENINPDIDQDVNVFYNSPDPSVRYFLLGYRAADATTTTRNSSKLGFRGTYWDGAVSQTLISEAQLEVLDTGPTTRFRISVPPTGDMFHLYSNYDCALQATFRPWTDNLYDLGTSSSRWRNGRFAGGVYVGSPVTGAYKGGILSPDGSIEIWRGTSGDPYIDFKTDYTTDYDVRINKTATHDLQFKVGGSGTIVEALRLLASGKVSIGPNELVFGTFGAEDVNLKRDAADVLKTDDNFILGMSRQLSLGDFGWNFYLREADTLNLPSGTTTTSDPTATNGTCIVRTSAQASGTMWYGPYENNIKAGDYYVLYRMKVASNVSTSSVIRIDAIIRDAGGVTRTLCSRTLSPADFRASDKWQTFVLFAQDIREDDYDFEIRGIGFVTGITDVYCDWVMLVPAGYLVNPFIYGDLQIQDGYSLKWSDVNLKRVGANILQTDGQMNASTFVSNKGAFPQAVLQYDGKILALPVDADATNTLRDSPWVVLRGEYWDGTTSVVRDVNIFHRMLSTTPTSEIALQIAGADYFVTGDNGHIFYNNKLKIRSDDYFNGQVQVIAPTVGETSIAFINPTYTFVIGADVWGIGPDKFGIGRTDVGGRFVFDPAAALYPRVDNLLDLGSSTYRWRNGYIVNLYTGDITLDNGMVITEDSRGVIFKSPTGEELMKLDMEGNLYVKGEIRQWN